MKRLEQEYFDADFARAAQRMDWERAMEETRSITWPRILAARDEFLAWEELCLWLDPIVRIERQVPKLVRLCVREFCPGFLEYWEKKKRKRGASSWCYFGEELRYEWIMSRLFQEAEREGWLFAVHYFSTWTSRYMRASAYSYTCYKHWRRVRPDSYPSFPEWRKNASTCNETPILHPHLRRQRASFKLVNLDVLQNAVNRYLEWETFYSWVLLAMETDKPFPANVAVELDNRCPGFRAFNENVKAADPPGIWRSAHRLLSWIHAHYFAEADAAGWLTAILIEVDNHPRSERIWAYHAHCYNLWRGGLPKTYPSFDLWRRATEVYLDLEAGADRRSALCRNKNLA